MFFMGLAARYSGEQTGKITSSAMNKLSGRENSFGLNQMVRSICGLGSISRSVRPTMGWAMSFIYVYSASDMKEVPTRQSFWQEAFVALSARLRFIWGRAPKY